MIDRKIVFDLPISNSFHALNAWERFSQELAQAHWIIINGQKINIRTKEDNANYEAGLVKTKEEFLNKGHEVRALLTKVDKMDRGREFASKPGLMKETDLRKSAKRKFLTEAFAKLSGFTKFLTAKYKEIRDHLPEEGFRTIDSIKQRIKTFTDFKTEVLTGILPIRAHAEAGYLVVGADKAAKPILEGVLFAMLRDVYPEFHDQRRFKGSLEDAQKTFAERKASIGFEKMSKSIGGAVLYLAMDLKDDWNKIDQDDRYSSAGNYLEKYFLNDKGDDAESNFSLLTNKQIKMLIRVFRNDFTKEEFQKIFYSPEFSVN